MEIQLTCKMISNDKFTLISKPMGLTIQSQSTYHWPQNGDLNSNSNSRDIRAN